MTLRAKINLKESTVSLFLKYLMEWNLLLLGKLKVRETPNWPIMEVQIAFSFTYNPHGLIFLCSDILLYDPMLTLSVEPNHILVDISSVLIGFRDELESFHLQFGPQFF